METSVLVLMISFFLLLALGIPIAFCIGITTVCTMLLTIDTMPALTTAAQRMAGGLDSFALLAIPFFIFSGLLMGRGGIATRLIEFAKVFFGMLPGGLAYVNVISCALFGSISGSAAASTSAIGSFMVPAMSKEGYDKNFSTALTITSSTTGLLIPPSNILIIYSLASGGVSVAALFLAGYIPGLLMAMCLMVVCALKAKKEGLPAGSRPSLKEVRQRTLDALPSLALIIIVIGGIIGGVFTATEASVISVLYAGLLTLVVYRELSWSELPAVMVKAAETTAIVLLLIAASTAMSWILSYENIPQSLSNALLVMSDNPLIMLLLINLILLVVGVFMDMTPAVLIFTPIMLPIAEMLGISPLHFGMIMVMNLCIGLCTPPVGSVLFIGCSVANVSIHHLIKPMMPMYAAMIGALLLVTFIPELSEFLPRVFGLYDPN